MIHKIKGFFVYIRSTKTTFKSSFHLYHNLTRKSGNKLRNSISFSLRKVDNIGNRKYAKRIGKVFSKDVKGKGYFWRIRNVSGIKDK